MEAKKSLGQHFLIDNGVLNRILYEVSNSVNIIEIGGGKGALTSKLVELGVPICVVELDKRFYTFLENRFKESNNFCIVNEDATHFRLTKKAVVVGNLPYNVSKKIIKNMITQKDKIDKMVFMVQKEVADTIVAEKDTKSYSKFSVTVQLYFKVKRLFNVEKTAFNPPPKVESSVVRFVPYDKNRLGFDIDSSFFSFLNVLFQFPRKTIRNNIKSVLNENMKINEHILNRRPRELSVEDMYQLYREVYYE